MKIFSYKSQKKAAFLVENEDLVILKVPLFHKREQWHLVTAS